MAKTLARATVVRREDFTDDLFCLWFRPQNPLTFKAGQYATIGLNGIERPYSIVSAPYEPLLELFIELVPPEQGGHLTPLLHSQRVGDTVTLRPQAKGRFTLRTRVAHHVMVATVTGIAPYVSMLRQFLHTHAGETARRDGPRFFLLHGASYQDEFVYDRELRRLSEAHSYSIEYIASVSRPSAARNAGWSGSVGRINLILEDCLTRWSLPREDTAIYLCGNPGMIEDAKGRLLPNGWSIVEEQYWTR